MTRAPARGASIREPSSEPLSAISTSPSIPERSRKLRALATQLPTVAASLRQGMRMVSSVKPFFAPAKKKVPRRVPFIEAKSLLLAAAGAGQILRADGGAVGVQSAAPAEQRLALAGRHRGRRCGGPKQHQRYVPRVCFSRKALHGGLPHSLYL